MSTEEFVQMVDQRIIEIDKEYPNLFERLGRCFFANQSAPECWPVRERIEEINKREREQERLRNLVVELRLTIFNWLIFIVCLIICIVIIVIW